MAAIYSFRFGEDVRAELERLHGKPLGFVPYLSGIPDAEVDFSHDGKWIAYIRLPDRTLWRSRVEGTDAIRLTSPALVAAQPHWSPDGEQLAFLAILPGERYKLHLTSSDGEDARRLVPGDAEEGVATWSKDGKSLVFGEPLRRRDPSAMTIHLLDLEARRISHTAEVGGPMDSPLVAGRPQHCRISTG